MTGYINRYRHVFSAATVVFAIAASSTAQPPPNITVIAGDRGPGSIPVSEFAGVPMVPLTAVASFVNAHLASSPDPGMVNFTVGNKEARISSGKTFVRVEGELKLLASPATVIGDQWFVPLDFLSKVLPLVASERVDYRERDRFLLVGEGFPQLQVRSVRYPAYTRVIVESDKSVPFRVEQLDREVQILVQAPYIETRFRDEELGDGVVDRVSLAREELGYRVTVTLGDRFGRLKAFELPNPNRVVLDLFRSRVPADAVGGGGVPGGPDTRIGDLRSMAEREATTEPVPTGPEGEQVGEYEDEEAPPDVEPGETTADDPDNLTVRHLPRDYELGIRDSTPLRPPPSQGPAELRIVTIDPGHGGAATGATGTGGLQEKNVVLSIARRFRQLLQQRLGLQVVLTRDGDRELPHDDRAAMANSNKSDLFISIHADASPRGNARGSSVYYLSYPATDADSQRVAAAQNQGSAAGDLQFILWDMAQASHLNQSASLAEILQEELQSTTGVDNVQNRGIKQNTFRVLMGASMPAVLVEVGFISNAEEEALLGEAEYQEKLAEALYRGVLRFKEIYESGESSGRAVSGRNE